MSNKLTMSSVMIAAAMTAGLTMAATQKAEAAGKEKCYGVSLKGEMHLIRHNQRSGQLRLIDWYERFFTD